MMDNKLQEDIRHIFRTKIKDLKSVNDLIESHTFQLPLIDKNMEEETYLNLYNLKKILQLIINAYHNFSFYEEGQVKFDSGDIGLLPHLKEYFHVQDKDAWCYKKPDEECVIKAMYNYVFCYLKIYAKESGYIEEIKKLDVSKCPFCDADLGKEDPGCNLCGATRDEILNQLKKSYNKKQTIEHIVETKENQGLARSRDYENKDYGLGSKLDRKNDSLGEKKDFKMDNFGNNHTRMERDLEDKFEGERSKAIYDKMGTKEKNVEVGKWRCGKCELINEYEYANCTACGTLSNLGWWTCEHCTMLNGLDKEGCGACGEENKYAQASGVRGGQHGSDNNILGSCPRCSLRYDEGGTVCRHCERQDNVVKLMDEWECGKCHLSVSYGLLKCEACGATRVGSAEWTCSKCTLKNKFTSNVCSVCGAENECLKAKYCIDCGIMKAVGRNDRCEDCGRKNSVKYQTCKWKCLYVKCGEMNNDGCQYCWKCQLDRFHSQKRGEAVRVGRDGDYTRSIWICFKCGMYNDLEDPVCTKCKEKRYKKRFCTRCQVYNNGSSINCDKCGDWLDLS